MKKTLKNAIIIMLATGLCLSIVGMVTAEQPTVGEITISPGEPTRESDVTFTVDITGDIIEEVYIKVEECVNPGTPNYFCHAGLLNESLTNIEDNTWEGIGTLQYDDSDEGHCWLVIKSNGTWYDYADEKSTWTNFTIVEGQDGTNGDDDNGDSGTDDTDGTPGFELVLVVISIVIAVSIYKKKRK